MDSKKYYVKDMAADDRSSAHKVDPNTVFIVDGSSSPVIVNAAFCVRVVAVDV